ncbi:uncharacterized protein LOC122371133 [Amphibalanus amphitrite]|uniref:uncharacterized protein LOC122371133 n=1 Tax=Amphibalanus amphitrite TaxID=1232801 RepID=UPI001C9069BF|nr:uncharacterized protein LOC122371133 [Amphibalanus amphitrite]
MMFDFGGDDTEETAAATDARLGEAGDGGQTNAVKCPPPQSLVPPPDPVARANEAARDEYGPPETDTDTDTDAVTALLPVLKDISRQFSEYSEAMETAVRDLAETENDLQAELQHMLRRSKQVLTTHGQMRQRFTERLGKVSRALRAQQSPATSQE